MEDLLRGEEGWFSRASASFQRGLTWSSPVSSAGAVAETSSSAPTSTVEEHSRSGRRKKDKKTDKTHSREEKKIGAVHSDQAASTSDSTRSKKSKGKEKKRNQ